MKIVIAPDSYKGSLSAMEAAAAIERGIKKADPSIETVLVPVADGGEGTMDTLVAATAGKKKEVRVTGPLGQEVVASYGVLGDTSMCVIEMAEASGLCLLTQEELNPLASTTFGTGQLIKQALDDGFRSFILAIGGSATNDGGAGMLQALGMKLVDKNGAEIGSGGGELSCLEVIDDTGFDRRIKESTFLIASDVENPLVGKSGASAVFGPQKGATAEMVNVLDQNLSHWADKVEELTGTRLHDLPGAGAAGGIGGAFQAFFSAQMKRGVDIVTEYAGLPQALDGADLVITGEGRVDFQTASGKTPMGVAQKAKEKDVPTVILAGSVGDGVDVLYQYGIISITSIIQQPLTLQEAMEQSSQLLEYSAEQVVRTFIHNKPTSESGVLHYET
ncbi:glycerate kinase [Fictibacillus enclensis]|uniref:Glycerate kinase n=1 Tax=Fictibacillus enclensis TaxID=1017270 RepID=A0A0V8J001_9BACL|nr:glycerate kinase [Fictibacillus enclensis]KSU80269.1 glycerate kinase [Fictibacillus enclensis]